MVANLLNQHERLYEEIAVAIEKNDTQLIGSMLTPENLSYSQNGLNFLTRAAELGNNHVLDFLWSKIPTDETQKAMILKDAILNDREDTVKLLVHEKGVDASAKIAGIPASFWAKIRGNSEIIELVSEHRTDTTADTTNNTGYNELQESASEAQEMLFQTSSLSKQGVIYSNNYICNYLPQIYTVASLVMIGTTYYASSYKSYPYDNGAPNPFHGIPTITTNAASTVYSYIKSFLGYTPKILAAASSTANLAEKNDEDFTFELPEGDSWREKILNKEWKPADYEYHETLDEVIQDVMLTITDTVSEPYEAAKEILDEVIESITNKEIYEWDPEFSFKTMQRVGQDIISQWSNPPSDNEAEIDDASGIPYEAFLAVGRELAEHSGIDLSKTSNSDDLIDIDGGSDYSGDWDGDIFYHSDTEI